MKKIVILSPEPSRPSAEPLFELLPNSSYNINEKKRRPPRTSPADLVFLWPLINGTAMAHPCSQPVIDLVFLHSNIGCCKQIHDLHFLLDMISSVQIRLSYGSHPHPHKWNAVGVSRPPLTKRDAHCLSILTPSLRETPNCLSIPSPSLRETPTVCPS